MIEVSIDKYKYIRLLTNQISQAEIDRLQEKYDHIFIVFYGPKPQWPRFEILKKKSPIIDLTLSLEEIFDNFNATTRNEIRKLDKIAGLQFITLDQNFEQIYQVYKKFELERNWMPILKEELVTHYIFTAYFQDKLISAVTCYGHGNNLRIAKIFSVRLEKNPEIKKGLIGATTRKLFFEICKYGRENNYHQFDLGGINFTDPAKAGITRFKQCFGGTITEVYVCRYMTELFRNFRTELKARKIDII